MLDEYQFTQPFFYNMVEHAIVSNHKMSHAYFIETNDFIESRKLAIDFAKFLICTSSRESSEDVLNSICHQIDNGTYDNFKLIEPDGLWIKKEALLELQVDFKTSSLDGNNRVYVINGADKLNKYAANALLKFLEEPSSPIIAILVAPSRYQVMDTIISRCQLIRLIPSDTLTTYDASLIDATIQFLSSIETKGTKTIAFYNKIWDNILNSKDELLKAIELMSRFYEEVLYFHLHRKKSSSIFSADLLEKIAFANTQEQILKKLDYLYSLPLKIKFNVNQNLLFDQIVIQLSGGVSV